MIANQFYNEFDLECFSDAYNAPRHRDHRSVFIQDRDRILFTNSFRRLQAKTQVFQAGEYDFYRTRLTHSLEVATIAKSICGHLLAHSEQLGPEFFIDTDLIEAICLAHDIGHPPFGHAGERVLNDLMAPFGGFEGNAQSLRILTRTIYNFGRERHGMGPSRALLDGILKYKRLYRDRQKETNHFIYDDQAPFLDFCFGADRPAGTVGNEFKSIECQIMDAADDIAYSCGDIADGVKARFITLEKLLRWQKDAALADGSVRSIKLEKLIERVKGGHVDASMGKTIGQFVAGCSLKAADNFMSAKSNRYRFSLVLSDEVREEIKLYKALSSQLVFGSPALQQIEFKGGQLLRQLTAALSENYLAGLRPGKDGPKSDEEKARLPKLLSRDLHELALVAPSESERARLVCDYLSGMTDAYAVRAYKRLFDPDYGSISELL